MANTSDKPEEITIELTRATTYVAPDLTTIFHKDTPYTMEADLAKEYLAKVDPSGIPYFKQWVEKKKPAPDPSLQGEVIRDRKTGGVKIVRRGVRKDVGTSSDGEIDTAANVIKNIAANAQTEETTEL